MKIKKVVLAFVLCVLMTSFVACGKNNKTKAPEVEIQEPNVSVTIPNKTYYVGDRLGDINISLVPGGTLGSVAWDNPNYVLEIGTNECTWTFLPENSDLFKTKSGKINIVAKNRLIEPVVTNVKIKDGDVCFVGAKLSTVKLEFDCAVAGSIDWKNPNEVFKAGTNRYEWVFTPADTETYSIVSKQITISDVEEQTISSIAVKSNTKTSGYYAFDEFDFSGLTLTLTYNAGKVVDEKVLAEFLTITYNSENCLHAGDTSVNVTYRGHDCTVNISEVAKKEIEQPAFTDDIVYDGNLHTLSIAASSYYSFTPLEETNAGTYNLTVSIADTANCKWKGTDENDIIVECQIKKANQTVTAHEYCSAYDKNAHGSYVESDGAMAIYYSQSELNSENYSSGSTEVINSFVNAGNYTIYYYSLGDDNHNDASGSLSVDISKYVPTISAEYCYSVKTGNNIAYPKSYVKVFGCDGDELSNDNLIYTYYLTFSDDDVADNDAKTTNSELGGFATTEGGAPKVNKSSPYFVLIEFAGDGENYDASHGVAELFIDSNETGLYNVNGEYDFVFKDDALVYKFNDTYYTGGTNQECKNYLGFELQETNGDGIKEIFYDLKYDIDSELFVEQGKVIKKDGKYKLVSGNGDVRELETIGNIDSIKIEIADVTRTLLKWELPKYLEKTFTAKTVADEYYDSQYNESQNTTIRFYNDLGTIRFELDYELPYVMAGVGGHNIEHGVAEIGRFTPSYNAFALYCYILDDDGYRASSALADFKVYWIISGMDNPTAVIMGEGEDGNLFMTGAIMEMLITEYTAQ